MIPNQLQNRSFRLIKVGHESKIPVQKGWQKTANYSYDDKAFQDWIKHKNNYGVACGFGNLIVVDCDKPKLQFAIMKNLPKTLSIMTGSGGTHFYFICKDLKNKIVVQKSNRPEDHYGEVQAKGQQVVGAGSIHPNGNKYKVVLDLPIAEVSKEEIVNAVKHLMPEKVDNVCKSGVVVNVDHSNAFRDEFDKIALLDVLKLFDIDIGDYRRISGGFLGKHPIHGATGEGNFAINVDNNFWKCFRCDSGGGAVQLYAMLSGMMTCKDLKNKKVVENGK